MYISTRTDICALLQELYEGLLGGGVGVTPEEIHELLSAGDNDSDGRLTLEEFLSCFDEVRFHWNDLRFLLESPDLLSGILISY